MQPVSFKQQNAVAQGGDDIQDLPITITSDKEIISCWKLSFIERLRLLFTGILWLCVKGITQPPVFMTVNENDIFYKECKKDIKIKIDDEIFLNHSKEEIVQSKLWDMNISLKELIDYNISCIIDTNYKRHKYDDCYNGYCIYLKHPSLSNDNYRSGEYSLMIGIYEDGFTYLGDGSPASNLKTCGTYHALYKMIEHANKIKENTGGI